ncbi:unnamed protein product, partial [Mesorhabditis spiculigera]
MASDRLCGCNVVTAAGIAVSLQLIIDLLCLASGGIILDRFRTWESVYGWPAINATEAAEYQAAGKTLTVQPNYWAQAWVELGMAWYVAFCSFWLFSLLIICLSFKYYRPVFVIPNFMALLVGIFMHLFAFAVLIARVLKVSKNYQTKAYEAVIFIYCMGLILFTFLINLLFLIFISRYHSFLRARYGHQVPKFVQSRPPRTAYPDDNHY